jgi:uncharacterized protein
MFVMQKLLEHIAINIVENPSAVVVTQQEKENSIILSLSVAPEDMGKVIGKKGRIAKSIRAIIKAAAINSNKHISVEII